MLVPRIDCCYSVSKLFSLSSFYIDHFVTNLIDVTSQPLATADLHIREPRKPLPPHTTIFLAVAMLTQLVEQIMKIFGGNTRCRQYFFDMEH